MTLDDIDTWHCLATCHNKDLTCGNKIFCKKQN